MARAKKRYKVLVLFDTAGTPPANQDFTKELKTDDWAAEAHIIRRSRNLDMKCAPSASSTPGMIIGEIKASSMWSLI
jgi:hypothetical protein